MNTTTTAEKTKSFSMVPNDLTRESGISDSAKTLFAYADRRQGDDGWSATGYWHTAEYLNWSPKKVRNAAIELERWGWFRLDKRTLSEKSQTVMVVIHNPARNRFNPDVKQPPRKVLSSLQRSPLSEGLVPTSTTEVLTGTSTCGLPAPEHRSTRYMHRSLGEGSSLERTANVQARASKISDEQFADDHPEISDSDSKLARLFALTDAGKLNQAAIRALEEIGCEYNRRALSALSELDLDRLISLMEDKTEMADF